MKKTELKQLIKEEINKVLKESSSIYELVNISKDHQLKKDVENIFDEQLSASIFKFDKQYNLVGIDTEALSDDIGVNPNKVVSLLRGMIKKNTSKYKEIKPEKYESMWSDSDLKIYPNLEDLDPDYYIVVKLIN